MVFAHFHFPPHPCPQTRMGQGFVRSMRRCDPPVGTEELAHLEMVGTLVHQLTKNATTTQIEGSPFAAYYIDHAKGVWPVSAGGQANTSMSIGSKGDPIADLVEDLAADAAIA